MPRTIQCKFCGLILNLPAKVVAGKRLKCPKCGTRFTVTELDASSESTLPGPADAATLSRFEMEEQPPRREDLSIPSPGHRQSPRGHAARPPSLDDLPLPVSEGDLRETFDLPLSSARDAERAGVAVGDAAALFDDRAGPKRRTTAADARTQARRCSNCGGLVPQGMSICVTCGVDQETGLRVGLEDDLAPPPPPPAQGPPIHIAITGGLCGIVGAILLILSLVESVRGNGNWEHYGWLCLSLVSGFGIFAAAQFIRGKSAKLLMLALSLGVLIDLLAMVALPLIRINFVDPESIVKPVHSNELDDADIEIEPNEERLDIPRIKLGVIFIFIYAVLSVYLMSPPVKRYFHARADKVAW